MARRRIRSGAGAARGIGSQLAAAGKGVFAASGRIVVVGKVTAAGATSGVAPVAFQYLLTENGNVLTAANGNRLLTESQSATSYLLTELIDILNTERPERLLAA